MLHYEERNSCSWFPSFVHALASGRGRLNPLVLMVGATSCITELPNTLHFARARERGRGQQLEILSHLNICWRSNSALQWLRKKTVIMGDMMENRVVSALTQHISWPNGNINGDHLAPLGNHMDNTWAPLGTTWRSQVGTTWKLHGQYLSTTWNNLETHCDNFGTTLLSDCWWSIPLPIWPCFS